jgi:high-affinity Fe2+/Pb2+ permease
MVIMEKVILILCSIVTGWVPLAFGIYIANKSYFMLAIGCMVVACCGFEQAYESFRRQEELKEKDLEIAKYKKKLKEYFQETEEKDKIIKRFARNYYDN